MPKVNGFDINIGADIYCFKGEKPVQINIPPVSTEIQWNNSIASSIKKVENFDLKVHNPLVIQSNPKSINAYNMSEDDSTSMQGLGHGFVSVNWGKDIDYKDTTHLDACAWLAKTLDAYLAIPALIWENLSKEVEGVVLRRNYYKAGSFIPTSEGMKYHVLSSQWLKRRSTRNLIFNNTIEALKRLFDDPDIRNKKYVNKNTKDIITDNNMETVSEMLEAEEIRAANYYRGLLGITPEEDLVL